MAKKRILLIAMFSIVVVLRFVFIFIMGPMPQDAYYFFYSQHPALSYFDHPPMIAVMLRVFSSVFGNNVIAIKIADSCITFITIVLFADLANCFLGYKQLKKAMLLLLSTLMVTILSLVSTPDAPLLLFWTLSLYLLYKTIFQKRSVYWLWSGIAMGLAFDSKYTAIFIPAGIILFLILSKPHRHHLVSKWFWLAVVAFFVVISPVMIWNAEHHFASFLFQSSSRVNSSTGVHFQIRYFLGLIGHQSLVITPILLVFLVWLVFTVLKKYRLNFSGMAPEKLFLLCFFLPLATSFILLSFLCWVKLNWLMPCYITGIIWASIYIPRKWVFYQMTFSFVVHVLMAVEIIFYPFPVQSDDTWFGWGNLAAQVGQLKKAHPSAFVFSADGYKTSAELNLLMPGFTYSQNVIGENALEFDYVNADLSSLKGKDALFIDSEPLFKNDDKGARSNEKLLQYFRSVEELNPILIKSNGHTVRKFLVYHCKGYLNIHCASTRRSVL